MSVKSCVSGTVRLEEACIEGPVRKGYGVLEELDCVLEELCDVEAVCWRNSVVELHCVGGSLWFID